MTWDCTTCQRYAALVPTEQPGVYRPVEYAKDGFTLTDVPHICMPREAGR
jgi:hypothetical protein